ncbi:MAG: hypothetical protein R3320_13265 [Nitriliruptorales bacterium]|nr:hypothetical protein [Nitriliruptorales bacterium]
MSERTVPYASAAAATGRRVARSAVTVAEMQARDLLRRRIALALFVLLPAAFYYSIPADQDYGVLAGSIGVSWAVAAAGMFGALGWRAVEPRLSLLSVGVGERLAGRSLVLFAMAGVLVALFTPLILVRSTGVIADSGAFVLALVLLAVVSVPFGLAVGMLARGELEGTLVVIGVVGVQMSMPPDAPGAAALPLYGPVHVLEVAVARGTDIASGVLHTSVTSALLFAVAWLWFRRRSLPRTTLTERNHP